MALTDPVSENDTIPQQVKRDHPAFKGHGAIIGEEELMKGGGGDAKEAATTYKRDNPVFKTTMEFRDEFEPLATETAHKAFRNIFTDPVEPSFPSISLDPKRNQSSVFSESCKEPIVFSRPIDPNRFASKVFSSDQPVEERHQLFSTGRERFESHIFDNEDVPATARITRVPKQLVSHIVHGESTEEKQDARVSEIDPSRFTSRIDFSEINSSAPLTCLGQKSTAHAAPSNSLLLGEGPAVESIPRKQYKANASSITFDFDNPQNLRPEPSTRYPFFHFVMVM
jgi:hypothetical protein